MIHWKKKETYIFSSLCWIKWHTHLLHFFQYHENMFSLCITLYKTWCWEGSCFPPQAGMEETAWVWKLGLPQTMRGAHPRLTGETRVISSRAFRLSLQRGLETRKEVFKFPLNPVSRELRLDTFMRFSWERNQREGWRSNSCMTLKPCLPPRKLQADHRHWLCRRNSCPLPWDHLE